MKKFSIWQKMQAILCFLILLCVFAPLGWIAISPSTASTLLNGILLDAPMSAAVAEVTVMQRVIMGAFVLVGVLCSLRMLVLMLGKGKKDRTGVSMPNTSEGAIHISVPAVETLVSQGIRDVPGLSDVRMKVHDYHDSISIEITMSARSDINIPETMMRLQSRIKAYVQESAGIEVREVRLNVDKVILADGGIPALPAGRMKRAGSSEQEIAKADYKPQSFTWKKDASEPVVETKSEPEKPAEEPKPEAKPEAKSEETQPAAVQSDKPVDDDDSDEGRRGLFGRLGHKRHNEAKSEHAEAEHKPEEGVDEFIKRFENGEDSVSQAQQNAAENVEKAIDEAEAVETARAAAEEAAMFEAESTEAGVAGAEDAELESAIAEEAADDLMAAQQQSEDAVVEEETSETEASEEEHAEEGTSEETSADEAPEETASEEVNAEKTASEEEPFEEPKPAAPIVIGDTASDMGTLKNDSDDNHTNVISL